MQGLEEIFQARVKLNVLLKTSTYCWSTYVRCVWRRSWGSGLVQENPGRSLRPKRLDLTASIEFGYLGEHEALRIQPLQRQQRSVFPIFFFLAEKRRTHRATMTPECVYCSAQNCFKKSRNLFNAMSWKWRAEVASCNAKRPRLLLLAALEPYRPFNSREVLFGPHAFQLLVRSQDPCSGLPNALCSRS